MEKNMEELLSVYERFGSKAQEALDFARRNMKPLDGIKTTIVGVAPPENGVYVVHKDGSYEEFDGENIMDDVAMIGIAYEGHTFGVPLDYDYGKQQLLKEDEYPKDEHCLNEVDALLNWDFKGETEYLKQLGLAFELKEGHYMPTIPVFLAMYSLRKELNLALSLAGAKVIDFDISRWFAQRSGVYYAWFFNGAYRHLSSNSVHGAFQVGAVSLWNPD